MADWTDGAEYAPLERPDGFATPVAAPLEAAEPEPHPSDGLPSVAPKGFGEPEAAPALESLAPSTGPTRDPQEPFHEQASPDGAWGAVHAPWNPAMPLGDAAGQRPSASAEVIQALNPQAAPGTTTTPAAFPAPAGTPVAPAPGARTGDDPPLAAYPPPAGAPVPLLPPGSPQLPPPPFTAMPPQQALPQQALPQQALPPQASSTPPAAAFPPPQAPPAFPPPQLPAPVVDPYQLPAPPQQYPPSPHPQQYGAPQPWGQPQNPYRQPQKPAGGLPRRGSFSALGLLSMGLLALGVLRPDWAWLLFFIASLVSNRAPGTSINVVRAFNVGWILVVAGFIWSQVTQNGYVTMIPWACAVVLLVQLVDGVRGLQQNRRR